MSGPRVKRPFAGAASDPAQRPITAFFSPGPGGGSGAGGGADGDADAWPSGPSTISAVARRLEPRVPADLLSVGMRVRKAVPEGYKTVAAAGAGAGVPIAPWASLAAQQQQQQQRRQEPQPQPQRQQPPRTIDHTPVEQASPAQQASATGPAAPDAPRELLPFCGILKVGGLRVQEHSYASRGAHSDGLDESLFDPLQVPDLVPSSSASSNSSLESVGGAASGFAPGIVGSAPHPGRKRLHEEDDEDGDESEWTAGEGAGAPAWIRPWGGILVERQTAAQQGNARLLARPRRSRQGQPHTQPGLQKRSGGVDFDEAPFLDPGLLELGEEGMEMEL